MNKLKRSIKQYFTKNAIEKEILKIKYSQVPNILRESQVIVIKQGLEGQVKDFNMQNTLNLIATTGFKDTTHWVPQLQFLVLFHRFMHSYGIQFANNFISLNLQQQRKILDLQKQKANQNQDTEAIVHLPIIEIYLDYLLELAQNYEYRQLSQQINQSGKIKIIFELPQKILFQKMQQNLNNINQTLKVIPQNFKWSLVKFDNYELTKHAAALLLNDIILQYDTGVEIIKIFIEEIFWKEKDEALAIYSLYELLIRITKNLEKFYNLKNLLIETQIRRPNYYVVDKEKNKQIEQFIRNINNNENSSPIKKTNLQKQINTQQESPLKMSPGLHKFQIHDEDNSENVLSDCKSSNQLCNIEQSQDYFIDNSTHFDQNNIQLQLKSLKIGSTPINNNQQNQNSKFANSLINNTETHSNGSSILNNNNNHNNYYQDEQKNDDSDEEEKVSNNNNNFNKNKLVLNNLVYSDNFNQKQTLNQFNNNEFNFIQQNQRNLEQQDREDKDLNDDEITSQIHKISEQYNKNKDFYGNYINQQENEDMPSQQYTLQHRSKQGSQIFRRKESQYSQMTQLTLGQTIKIDIDSNREQQVIDLD